MYVIDTRLSVVSLFEGFVYGVIVIPSLFLVVIFSSHIYQCFPLCFFLTYYLCSPSNFTVSYFTGKYLIHFEITEMGNRVSQHHLLNNMFPLHLLEVLSLSHTKFLHVFISGQSIFFH